MDFWPTAPLGFPVLRRGASVSRQVRVQAREPSAVCRPGCACKGIQVEMHKKKKEKRSRKIVLRTHFILTVDSRLGCQRVELSIAFLNPVESVSTSTCSVSTFRVILPKLLFQLLLAEMSLFLSPSLALTHSLSLSFLLFSPFTLPLPLSFLLQWQHKGLFRLLGPQAEFRLSDFSSNRYQRLMRAFTTPIPFFYGSTWQIVFI